MLPGIEPLSFTGRSMGGFVDIRAEAMEDQQTLHAVIQLAIDYVSTLPGK